jgi:hypothetical protein
MTSAMKRNLKGNILHDKESVNIEKYVTLVNAYFGECILEKIFEL